MTMARLRWYALTTVGGLFIVWELITEVMSPYGPDRWDLAAILIVIPMYAVGAWLTWRLPTHPQPVRLLVCGTAIAVGLAGLVGKWPWSPALGALSLEAAAVALLAMALLIGSFPDGFVERRWQRLALRCSWVILIGAPLALLASPVVPVFSDAAQYRPAIPNPYAVSWLAWLAQPAAWLALNSGWVLLVGVLVLCARFVAADAAAGLSCESSSLSFSGCCSISQAWWRRHLAHPKTRYWYFPDQPGVADGDSASGGDQLRDSAP